MSVRKVKSAPSKLNTETRKNILERLIQNIDLSGKLSNYLLEDVDSIKTLYDTSRRTREFVLHLQEEVFVSNSSTFRQAFIQKSKIVKSITKHDRIQMLERLMERIQSVKKSRSLSVIVEGIKEIETLFNTLYGKLKTSNIIYTLLSLKTFFEYLIKHKSLILTVEIKKLLKTKIDRYSILMYEFTKYVLCLNIKNKTISEEVAWLATYLHSTGASIIIDKYYDKPSPDYNKYVKVLFYLLNGQNEFPLKMGENVMLYNTLYHYKFIGSITREDFAANILLHRQIFKQILDFIYNGGLKIELTHKYMNIDLII